MRTTVFRNNRTQAVRVPKALELPADVREVEIRAVGRTRVIEPAGSGWDEWFEHGERVAGAFPERDQGVAEDRPPL